jgi:hypothetical protein
LENVLYALVGDRLIALDEFSRADDIGVKDYGELARLTPFHLDLL